MDYVNYNVRLFNLNMTPQQRKVATYLQEILKWNNQKSLPSNKQISKDCGISVNSISKIIAEIKLQLLHQNNDGVWFMTMPSSESNELKQVDDSCFEDGTFQYVKIDMDTFTTLSAELIETYVRIASLASYMKANKNFTPSWTTLSDSWNINKETLRKRVYTLRDLGLIKWQLNENSFISKIWVIQKSE